MKKLFTSLIIFLTLLLIVSCSNGSTDPNNNNNNNNSQSFTGNFTFGVFGQASALTINEDGSIYMNVENGLLTIKKEMVTKISDSQYHIKGEMPVINYDTSAASLKSSMSFQNAANMNTIDVMLSIGGGSLSLSGKVNNDSVSATLQEVSGYINNNYAGIYFIGDDKSNTEIEIKSDGYVTMKGIENGIVVVEQEHTDKLIKISENEYILNNNSAKINIPSTGTISFSDAESIVITEAMKYYNISQKSTLKFENNTLTITGQGLIVSMEGTVTETIKKYIEEVAKDRSYTNQIDYSLFSLKLTGKTSTTFTKK